MWRSSFNTPNTSGVNNSRIGNIRLSFAARTPPIGNLARFRKQSKIPSSILFHLSDSDHQNHLHLPFHPQLSNNCLTFRPSGTEVRMNSREELRGLKHRQNKKWQLCQCSFAETHLRPRQACRRETEDCGKRKGCFWLDSIITWWCRPPSKWWKGFIHILWSDCLPSRPSFLIWKSDLFMIDLLLAGWWRIECAFILILTFLFPRYSCNRSKFGVLHWVAGRQFSPLSFEFGLPYDLRGLDNGISDQAIKCFGTSEMDASFACSHWDDGTHVISTNRWLWRCHSPERRTDANQRWWVWLGFCSKQGSHLPNPNQSTTKEDSMFSSSGC